MSRSSKGSETKVCASEIDHPRWTECPIALFFFFSFLAGSLKQGSMSAIFDSYWSIFSSGIKRQVSNSATFVPYWPTLPHETIFPPKDWNGTKATKHFVDFGCLNRGRAYLRFTYLAGDQPLVGCRATLAWMNDLLLSFLTSHSKGKFSVIVICFCWELVLLKVELHVHCSF